MIYLYPFQATAGSQFRDNVHVHSATTNTENARKVQAWFDVAVVPRMMLGYTASLSNQPRR